MSTDQQPLPLGLQTPLCRLDDIADGGARGVSVYVGEQWDLVLLRQGDDVYAYHNECAHAGRNLDYVPGKFLIDKGRIICAAHGASFDIESGDCCGGPARAGLKAVPVRVVDGAVWVDRPAADLPR
ncbi:MAG: Rieske (2Fe-2S) protein [Rhodanobacteraceae bacterium]